MTVKEIAELFQSKDYMLSMGAGKLSKWLECSKEDIYEAKDLARSKSKKSIFPKILILDIETAPMKAYVWSRWKQNIYLDQTISEWFMLSWSGKFLYSSEILSDKVTGEEALREDDKRIVTNLWRLLDEADIIVAHNGDSFDIPKINARFLLHNLPPTTSYEQIDTKKIAAKQFGFSSNKLDALAGYFGFDAKKHTDFKLWVSCVNGDEDALAYMEEYNRYDVQLLEDVYLRMRPWIKAHPNIGLYLDLEIPVCANCGSTQLHKTGTLYHTQTGKYPEFRCSCGALTRGRKSVQDKEVKKALVIGLGR